MPDVSVLICDAQFLFAQALARALAWVPDLAVIEEYPTSGPNALDAVERTKPDVVLFDYWMPELYGPQAAATMRKRVPESKVILLSWFHGPHNVRDGLAAGAVGFIPKAVSVEEVADSIRRAHAGESPVNARGLGELVQVLEQRRDGSDEIDRRVSSLSPREREVLMLLSRGSAIKDVAKKLGLSPGTVKNHVAKILRKLDAHSQVEAIALVRDSGSMPL